MKSKYKKLEIPKISAWDKKTYNPYKLFKNWFYDKYRYTYVGYYVCNFFNAIDSFATGVKNIVKWMPYIYKDRDYDYNNIYSILQKKIEFTRDKIVLNNRHTRVPIDNFWMTLALNLIEVVRNEDYESEYFKYIKKNYSFDKIDEKDEKGGSLFEMNSKVIYDKTYKYVNANPSKVRLLQKSNPNFDMMDDEDKSREIGMYKQKQAKKLLFQILERKIEYWWD